MLLILWYYFDIIHWSTLVYIYIYIYISILSLIIFFLCSLYILYLAVFPFKIRVVDRDTIKSTSLQNQKSILSHFSYLTIPTLSHFFFLLQESHFGIPIHRSFCKYLCPATHKPVELRMTPYIFTSRIMHHLPFPYLAYFLECVCGTTLIFIYLFLILVVPQPVISFPPKYFIHFHNPQNWLFLYLVYFTIVDARAPPYLFNSPAHIRNHHIALSIPHFKLP